MAIQNQGWAYVSGSAAGAAGGSDTQIQFNNAGTLGGSPNLTWDSSTVATTDISASINISASAFYGDGSNLTGITASAVNVADGPEQAIQFRVDAPVSGEISGSSAFMFMTGSNTVKLDNASLSSSLNISASAFYFGPGGRQQISDTSTDMSILAASTGMFISADGGNLTLQGQVAIDTAGALTASAGILANSNPGSGPSAWVSASNPSYGGGNVYGSLWFGSGSNPGSGFTGASLGLNNFGYGTDFELRSKAGGVTIRSDDGDTIIRATDGEVILSGSAGIIGQTSVNLNAGLNTNNDAVNINAGMNVNNTVLTINSSLQNNGVSTFNDTATFNNSASVHNQGINVNNARGTFNSGLTVNNASAIFNDSVTLGDASGDGVTWNAGSWNMSANSVVTTLKDGVDGVSGNGALMFFTGSGGDFMKFHTSGSAKGIVFPQQTYLSKGGSLSGTLAGPGSFLAIDSSNKVVLATPPAGGGGGGIFTEINGTQAATTSSVSVGTSGSPLATLYVSSSNNESSFRVDNLQSATKGPALFVTGARGDGAAVQCLGIGTDTPAQALDVNGYITIGSSGGAYIMVNDDSDTWIRFGHSGADSMQFRAGNVNFLEFDENGLDHALFNSASADVNFHVRSAANSASFFVEGNTGNIGMGTGSPKTALDIHYTGSSDPTNLSNDTGGGEVVYFGTASGLTAGHLYFLNVSGGWASGSAADSSYGATNMLGISLGTNPADHGMLTRGYFNADTVLSNFITGSVIYMSETSGTLTTTAPNGTGDIVRIVGHCAGTPNIIYFNPSPGWIEIA